MRGQKKTSESGAAPFSPAQRVGGKTLSDWQKLLEKDVPAKNGEPAPQVVAGRLRKKDLDGLRHSIFDYAAWKNGGRRTIMTQEFLGKLHEEDRLHLLSQLAIMREEWFTDGMKMPKVSEENVAKFLQSLEGRERLENMTHLLVYRTEEFARLYPKVGMEYGMMELRHADEMCRTIYHEKQWKIVAPLVFRKENFSMMPEVAWKRLVRSTIRAGKIETVEIALDAGNPPAMLEKWQVHALERAMKEKEHWLGSPVTKEALLKLHPEDVYHIVAIGTAQSQKIGGIARELYAEGFDAERLFRAIRKGRSRYGVHWMKQGRDYAGVLAGQFIGAFAGIGAHLWLAHGRPTMEWLDAMQKETSAAVIFGSVLVGMACGILNWMMLKNGWYFIKAHLGEKKARERILGSGEGKGSVAK